MFHPAAAEQPNDGTREVLNPAEDVECALGVKSALLGCDARDMPSDMHCQLLQEGVIGGHSELDEDDTMFPDEAVSGAVQALADAFAVPRLARKRLRHTAYGNIPEVNQGNVRLEVAFDVLGNAFSVTTGPTEHGDGHTQSMPLDANGAARCCSPRWSWFGDELRARPLNGTRTGLALYRASRSRRKTMVRHGGSRPAWQATPRCVCHTAFCFGRLTATMLVSWEMAECKQTVCWRHWMRAS